MARALACESSQSVGLYPVPSGASRACDSLPAALQRAVIYVLHYQHDIDAYEIPAPQEVSVCRPDIWPTT